MQNSPIRAFFLAALGAVLAGVAATALVEKAVKATDGPPVSDGDLVLRAGRAAEAELQLARLALVEALHIAGGDSYLRSAAEDLDHDATRSALASICEGYRLTSCAGYDADLDVTTDGAPPLTDAERAVARDLSAGDTSVRLTSDAGGPTLVGLAPLRADGEGLGFVRLTAALDAGFAGRLATLAGAPVTLSAGSRVVVAAARAVAVGSWTDAGGQPLPGWTIDGTPLEAFVERPVLAPGRLPDPRALLAGALIGGLGLLLAGGLVLRRLVAGLGTFQGQLKHLVARPDDAPLPGHLDGLVAGLAADVADGVRQLRELLRRSVEGQHDMERKLARVGDLTAIDSGAFRLFREKAGELHGACAAEIAALRRGDGDGEERLSAILRHVHTLKGLARLFNMQRVQQAARAFEEHLVAALREGTEGHEHLNLLAMHLEGVEKEVATYRDLRTRLLGDDGRSERVGHQQAVRGQWLLSLVGRALALLGDAVLLPEALSGLYAEYGSAAASVAGEDLAEYLGRYERMLQEQARAAGKQLEPLELAGSCRFLPHAVLKHVNDALLHGLRNALDHGIEAPALRRAAGKPDAGRIVVECDVVDSLCTLVIRDDGRGIEPGALRARAVHRGFYTAAEAAALSEERALDLIFASGFSTAPVVTDTSGRGVGLGVVRDVARRLGGDARVCSAAGIGTELHLHFPLAGPRFAPRQTVFNLAAALRAAGAATVGSAGGARLVVRADDALASRSLVCADRIVFATLLRELLQTTLVHAPAGGTLTVQLASVGRGVAGLETFAIGVEAADAQGRPAPAAFLEVGLASGERFGGLLLECGLYVTEPAGKGTESARLEFQVPAGVGTLLAGETLDVLVLTRDPASVGRLLAKVGREQFAGIGVRLHGADAVDGFLAAGAGTHGMLLVDDATLADTKLLRRLAGKVENVVAVTQLVAGLPYAGALRLAADPLVLEGSLDEGALSQALAFSALSRLQRSRQKPFSGLAAAA